MMATSNDGFFPTRVPEVFVYANPKVWRLGLILPVRIEPKSVALWTAQRDRAA
jgi:hypothetical protein